MSLLHVINLSHLHSNISAHTFRSVALCDAAEETVVASDFRKNLKVLQKNQNFHLNNVGFNFRVSIFISKAPI